MANLSLFCLTLKVHKMAILILSLLVYRLDVFISKLNFVNDVVLTRFEFLDGVCHPRDEDSCRITENGKALVFFVDERNHDIS